ncbi:probable Histone-lysine N-methyltransferase ATXR5 [Impatiens glandulifera]|uniref:probable Histone-lysine N-methyltransferase ATXR5 n=1 Tax=Impatiens glandulifera TaxID=253017 RepID=UPI001FB18FCD|nr:probable Histone-lysine N-methyltransferase ATXR5 [Impatiens glandulifera]
MAPSASPVPRPAANKPLGVRRRSSPPPMKFRSMKDIMKVASYAVIEREDYTHALCEQCGSGDRPDEMLLCDKCDKGYHMLCLRPIVARVPIGSWYCLRCSDHPAVKRFSQTKIIDFFRLQKCFISPEKCSSNQDARKRRRRSSILVVQKKKRRLLPFIPSEDPAQRLEQMGTLASALTALRLKFSNDLTYKHGMAPRSANQSELEYGGMQVLSREDIETLEQCKTMSNRGECPPLRVVFDSCEGYTVEAGGPIKDMTLITEYIGDVDYIKNRERDDCDSMMALLLSQDPYKSLVICPDKHANIARFINGINNHTLDGKKKKNIKCVRYSVNGECRVLLVAMRDIAKGERLYYDYNGYEQEYPTHLFV